MFYQSFDRFCFIRSFIVPRMKQFYKNPLRPFVIRSIRSSDFSTPIEREANFTQLFFVSGNILLCSNRRMLPSLNRILFCWQTERIITDRMQNVKTLMSLEPCINIRGDITKRVTYV